MTQYNPPPPIDYDQRTYSQPAAWPLREFLIGFGIGILISAIAWTAFWGLNQHDAQPIVAALTWGAVAAKLLTAIVLMCFPRRRLLGAGLLCSAVIGFLIFFGLCFATITTV